MSSHINSTVMVTPSPRVRAITSACVFFFLGLSHINAQTPPLNQRVLVVYNAGDTNSTAVANYYTAQREIPTANLCAINPPSTSLVSWAAFVSSIKTPVQHCLTAVGPSTILYIVFTYNTPYDLTAPDQTIYSLDQYVADIWDIYQAPGQYGPPGVPHPYFAAAQAQGNVYTPFQSLATFRRQTGTLIYSVWRLDAATPALATGLVDKAIAAETAGLVGQVCIDETTSVASYDYSTDGMEWDLRLAATFARLAAFNVMEDSNAAEFGSPPAPLRCESAALYAGWYSFNNYNNAFTWKPGAIGYHIDSASAVNPRGASNWAANALINGITATHGSVSEPYLSAFAHPDGVFRNLFEGANLGDAFLRNTAYLKWMMLNTGDPLYRPFPAGIPAVTAPVNSLALNPQYLIGGTTSVGTITLASAPTADTTFVLTSTLKPAATVPPSITVPAGQRTVSFPISTNAVANDSPLLISAVAPGLSLTNTLVPMAVFAALTVNPTSVSGGTSATGTISLNAYAPSGGLAVTLASSNAAAASVPPVVTVQAGASSATFPIATSLVSSTTTLLIIASYSGLEEAATLTVTAAPPTISSVDVIAITNTSATVNWTTDNPSTSQVTYGTTASYGSLSALSSTFATSHSLSLTGLTPATLYHYQVMSVDPFGRLATSADYTFMTTGAPLLQLHLDQTEVSGLTNGSVVTPSIAPAGFTGTVVANGNGSVAFTPAQTGNGSYFLNCCGNSNNAYYKFIGTTVGNIFDVNQGQITFYLKSRYSFAQRRVNAAGMRYAFDVRDGNGSELFNFITQATYGYLQFNYSAGGSGTYYIVPVGTEDAFFGNGVVLQASIRWGASGANLYLNNTLAASVPYRIPAPSWTSGSVFDVGAREYLTFGGYNISDDVIDEFVVTGSAVGQDMTPPVVSITTPVNGATVGGSVTLTANATDNVGVTGVQFQLDGSNLGSIVSGTGPAYAYSWNSQTATNGPHTLTAVASDAAGNTANTSISLTVDTISPTVSIIAPLNGATVSGTVSVVANATDSVGVTGVQLQVDGTNLDAPLNGTGPSYGYTWDTTTVGNGLHTLTATASDPFGNAASSSVSITVNNLPVAPVISAVMVESLSSSGVTITWTTDKASSSQVVYGTSDTYGSQSALNKTPSTSHVVQLTGLLASTTYHYQVRSQGAGGLVTSTDMTFTTAPLPVGPQPILQLHLDQTEVSGLTNESVVTPSIAPAGFTGTVVANGNGSVAFAPAQTGNGVYFLNCCGNSNNAYYKFIGTTVGNIFDVNQGQITFYLKSRYSFAQRKASAAAMRYAFDVRDGNGNELFNFITQATYGYLQFNYSAGGSGTYYIVPVGTEDAFFGNGVVLQVSIRWGASGANLYLNNTLAASVPYRIPAPSWTSGSVFDVGAREYLTFGGYSTSDDVIDEFRVLPMPQ